MALPSNFLGDLIASTQGGTVEPPAPNAFGQALQAGSALPDLSPIQTPGMTSAQAGAMPRIAEARPRRSILDMIGGIADTVATVGGAAPLYQQNLDAQRAREIANEDRQYQIEQRPIEQQMAQLKLQRGQQEVASGALDLQGARNELLNSAGAGMRQVFGQSGTEGVLKAWPLLAKNLGIPDEQAAKIGESLATDPEATIAALFPDPTLAKGGSKAKEVQIYELLKSEGDTETAAAYRKALASGGGEKPMTAYQREQVRLAEERLGLARDRYENPPQSAAQRNMSAKEAAAAAQKEQAVVGATQFLDDLEGVVNDLNDSGGMTNSNQSIAGTLGTAAREYLPLVERVTSPEGFAARERLDGLLTQGVSSLLPLLTGMTIGSKNMDAAKEMENLKRAVVSAKSYDAAIAAINQYRRNLQAQIRTKQETSAPAPRAAPRRSTGSAPQRKVTTVTTAAEYNRLPKGARFVDDKGNLRVKK